jgi:hypothetical protein
MLDIWLQLVRVCNWWWVAIDNGRPLFFVSLMRYWDLLHVLNVAAFLINHRILMRRH